MGKATFLMIALAIAAASGCADVPQEHKPSNGMSQDARQASFVPPGDERETPATADGNPSTASRADAEVSPPPSPMARLEVTRWLQGRALVAYDEAKALVPDGWRPACHLHSEDECLIEAAGEAGNVSLWLFVIQFEAGVANGHIADGSWAGVLLEVIPPPPIHRTFDTTNHDFILLETLSDDAEMHRWLANWGLSSALNTGGTVSVTTSGDAGAVWIGGVEVSGGLVDAAATATLAGAVPLSNSDNDFRAFVFDPAQTTQPTRFVRIEYPVPGGWSNGPAVFEGGLPGFSARDWQGDMFWHSSPGDTVTLTMETV